MTAWPEPTSRIKVCGLTGVADALACASAGADWIGLNFHPGSPRRIDPGLAAEIIAALPARRHRPSACSSIARRARSSQLADRLGLRIVQLHGQEPPDDSLALSPPASRPRLPPGRRRGRRADGPYLASCRGTRPAPDAVLVDAYVPGQAGGYRPLHRRRPPHPAPPLPRLILAGGLTPENVADRVARVRPWMVDVASGVESAPGRKDPARVTAFIKAARASAG